MRTARIILLLAAIFAAGVFTGRWSAPRLPVTISTAGGVSRTSEDALRRLSRQVGLDDSQQKRLRPILEEIAEKMAAIPPKSRARLELYQNFIPKMRAELRPDQHEAFDRYAEDTTRRFERVIGTGSTP